MSLSCHHRCRSSLSLRGCAASARPLSGRSSAGSAHSDACASVAATSWTPRRASRRFDSRRSPSPAPRSTRRRSRSRPLHARRCGRSCCATARPSTTPSWARCCAAARSCSLDLCSCGGVRGTFCCALPATRTCSRFCSATAALSAARWCADLARVAARPPRGCLRSRRAGGSGGPRHRRRRRRADGDRRPARAAQWLRGGHDASSSDDNDSDERPLDHALVGELTAAAGRCRLPAAVAARARRRRVAARTLRRRRRRAVPGARRAHHRRPRRAFAGRPLCARHYRTPGAHTRALRGSAPTLACLKACPHLRKLTLRRCAGFGAAAAEELHGLTELRTVALCGVKPLTDGVDVESAEAWLDGVRAATPAHAALEVVESVDAGAAAESVDRWASSVADADAF